MEVNPLAGKPAPASMLVNVPRLITAYYEEHPDPSVAAQRVAFGTSGIEAPRSRAHLMNRTSSRSRRRFAVSQRA